MAFTELRMWQLFAVVAVAPISLFAQTPVMSGAARQTIGAACTDKAQLVSLTVSNPTPTYGTPVTLAAQIKNVCSSGTANIPWKMTLGSTQIATGTASNVAAGATVNVTHTWTADLGTFTLDAEADPSNTLDETSASRNNNYAPNSPVLNVAGNWTAWATTAKTVAKSAFLSWFQQSEMTNITISIAPTTRGGMLKSSYDLNTNIRSQLISQGVPATVATAIAGGLSDGWNAWAASVRIQDLPLFPPPHTSWGASSMPQMPSGAPPPLLKVFQQNVSPVTSGNLAQAMKTKLGALASQPGAGPAMDDIAQSANVCFSTLQGVALVSRLMGGGPTNYSPFPPNPGAVINGTASVPKGAILTPTAC